MHGAVQTQPALMGLMLHPRGSICLGEAENRCPSNMCCPHRRQLSMLAPLCMQAEPEQTLAGRRVVTGVHFNLNGISAHQGDLGIPTKGSICFVHGP